MYSSFVVSLCLIAVMRAGYPVGTFRTGFGGGGAQQRFVRLSMMTTAERSPYLENSSNDLLRTFLCRKESSQDQDKDTFSRMINDMASGLQHMERVYSGSLPEVFVVFVLVAGVYGGYTVITTYPYHYNPPQPEGIAFMKESFLIGDRLQNVWVVHGIGEEEVFSSTKHSTQTSACQRARCSRSHSTKYC